MSLGPGSVPGSVTAGRALFSLGPALGTLLIIKRPFRGVWVGRDREGMSLYTGARAVLWVCKRGAGAWR